MQEHFYRLVDEACGLLEGDEVVLCNFASEDSDFVRFNGGLLRQPGRVTRHEISLDLIRGQRHAAGSAPVSGDIEMDKAALGELVKDLREKRQHVPEDPHLMFATEVNSTEQAAENRLPDSGDAVEQILPACKGLDLVGIFSAGAIHRGFANSLGQRNWFASYSFDFDWSLYHAGDKAVKSRYAGFEWRSDEFERKLQQAKKQLKVLSREPLTIERGGYRVFLTPKALSDFVRMLGYGFGLEARRTKHTPLLKMLEGEKRLSEKVTLIENTREGLAQNFQSQGFVRPGNVTLIRGGELAEPLVSPRSAKEYGVETNGANSGEAPESLDMAAGDISEGNALERLGTGVFVSDLHYLNYSDVPGCRITGLTRFATLWVENGEIKAPVNVMRFDDTAYRVLGENLVGLTKERELLPSSSTYQWRSTSSIRLPGAVVDDFKLTL